MKVSTIDNFKLLFSDEYKISDRDYKTLSDILTSKGLSEDAFNSGLVSLVKILIDGNYKLPITLKFLKLLWEKDYTPYKFIDMLTGLVKLGYIKIEKVSRDSKMDIVGMDIAKDSNIGDGEFDLASGKVLIVNGSDILSMTVDEFSKFINDRKRIHESTQINESTSIYPSYVKDFLMRLNTRYLKEFQVSVSIESYVDEGNKESLSLIFHDTSDYTLKDKEIKKLADKYVKKVNIVLDTDIYKESSDELYMGMDLTKSKDLKVLLDPIYKFISDLEINNA